jgi:peptidyl-tRNA hydrolase, PTH1 family
MGLFQKKLTNTSTAAPLYTLGGQSLLLIVGLGNPGEKYAPTRHNVGYMAVDSFVSAHDEINNWIHKKDLQCDIAIGTLGPSKLLIIKPTTFMNESGRAVHAVQMFYKVHSKQTIVIHDELDIDFGQIRTRIGGGAAGHNGIKSIINHCGDEFGRVRVGINNEHKPLNDTSDFVLKPFSKEEQGNISAMNREIESILVECIYRGNLEAETRNYII